MTSKPPFAKKRGASPYASYAEVCAAYYEPVRPPSLNWGYYMVVNNCLDDNTPIPTKPKFSVKSMHDSFGTYVNGMLLHTIVDYDEHGNEIYRATTRYM